MANLQNNLVLFATLVICSLIYTDAWVIQHNSRNDDERNIDYFAELEALKFVNSTQKGHFCSYPGVPCFKGVYSFKCGVVAVGALIPQPIKVCKRQCYTTSPNKYCALRWSWGLWATCEKDSDCLEYPMDKTAYEICDQNFGMPKCVSGEIA